MEREERRQKLAAEKAKMEEEVQKKRAQVCHVINLLNAQLT
jgi:hypothetical protein